MAKLAGHRRFRSYRWGNTRLAGKSMTPVNTAIADGRLKDAIGIQMQAVADRPDDPSARLLLFELLTVAGQFPEARDQLRAIKMDDPDWRDTRRRFGRLLQAASRRDQSKRPAVASPVPAHLRQRWRATRAIRSGEVVEAIRHIDRADARSPIVEGFIDGREFEGLRDADDRHGSVLEVFVEDTYCWFPFEQIRKLTLLPVVGLLDAIYRPARLTLNDQIEQAVLVPLVYPLSHEVDGSFALGHDTDWPDVGGPVCGIGAKIWLLGEEEGKLGEYRQLEIRKARIT